MISYSHYKNDKEGLKEGCLRMLKRRLIIIMLVIFMLTISACGSNRENDNSDPKTSENSKSVPIATPEVSDIWDKISSEIESPPLKDIPPVIIEEFYGFKVEDLNYAVFKRATQNTYADEIAIIKVKDSNQVPQIIKGIEGRVKDLQSQFEEYLPEEREKVDNYKIENKGDYILFVISNDESKIISIYESFFK